MMIPFPFIPPLLFALDAIYIHEDSGSTKATEASYISSEDIWGVAKEWTTMATEELDHY